MSDAKIVGKSINGAIVERYQYTRYDGIYTESLQRIFSFVRFEIKSRIWQARTVRWALYIWIAFWFFIVLANLGQINYYMRMDDPYYYPTYFLDLYYLLPNTLDIQPFGFALFSFYTFLPAFIYIAAVTGRLIFYDRQNRTIEDYFARISRWEYLTGKFASAFFMVATPFYVMAIISYVVYTSALRVSIVSIENLYLLCCVFFWIAILTLLLCLIGVFLSTLPFSNSPSATTIVYTIILIISTTFSQTLAFITGESALLFNVFLSTRTVLNTLIGGSFPDYIWPGSYDPVILFLISIIQIVVLITLCSLGTYYQVILKDP
ncbi:MAG: hypothetical protein ACFFC7_08470 [Candidatus Hermodarchaeota archaeon]